MAVKCNVSDIHLYTVSSDFLSSDDSFSIMVWIKAVWSSGSVLSLVGMYDGGLVTPAPTTGVQIGSRGTGQATAWTYGGTVLAQSPSGSMTPYDNTWVLISYTFDGTTHRLYRNDTQIATGTTAVVVGKFTQIYINGYPPTGNAAECGTHEVDTYGYYNRTLSAEEIGTIFNCHGTRHGIAYGTIARYDFDELPEGGTASAIVDVTGNGNTMLSSGAGSPITYTYTNTIANSNLRPVQ